MELDMELDNYLKIKTTGRDDSNANYMNFPYEPTPYSVLQTLSNSGYISKKDVIVDFGCGKGRVDFYLAYMNKAKMIGIEYDKRIYDTAVSNLESAISASKVKIINISAEEYTVPSEVTGAYFFNPFSVHILEDVLHALRKSKKKDYREIKLFFYYPSDHYLNVLNSASDIIHIEDLDCKNQFKKKDNKEYIAVYKLI